MMSMPKDEMEDGEQDFRVEVMHSLSLFSQQ